MKRIVHLVDDDEDVRRGVGFMLRGAGYAVTAYPSGVAFLKVVKEAAPGCILLDVRMPEMDGLEVQQALRERGVTMPVIVFTGHGDISVAVRAMKAGAVDFVEKPFEKQVLLETLNAAFARLEKVGRDRVEASEAEMRLNVLSARERDVLQGLVQGYPNKTIAYDLGISPRTVEIHRANIMSKVGVRNLSDLLRIAFAAGVGTGQSEDGPVNQDG